MVVLRGVERGVEVGDQVRGGLDADRHAQQVTGHRGGGSLHAAPVLDQALHPAERGGPLEHPDGGQHRQGVPGASGQPDRQHPAETTVHLTGRDLVTRMRRQPRVEHLPQRRVTVEARGDRQRGA
jgi:hypothetical protein